MKIAKREGRISCRLLRPILSCLLSTVRCIGFYTATQTESEGDGKPVLSEYLFSYMDLSDSVRILLVINWLSGSRVTLTARASDVSPYGCIAFCNVTLSVAGAKVWQLLSYIHSCCRGALNRAVGFDRKLIKFDLVKRRLRFDLSLAITIFGHLRWLPDDLIRTYEIRFLFHYIHFNSPWSSS